MDNLNDHDPITVIEFCAGYGGLGLGIKGVLGERMRLIGLCELEGFAQANLISKMEAGLMAQVPIWSNLLTFPYRKFRGLVDIAAAGIPCQPHSLAGKRSGGGDERFLFDDWLCGLEQMQPRAIFIENVEGFLSSKMPDGTLCVEWTIKRLEAMGYQSATGIFSAREVGAPHQRKRVFVMAHRDCERGQLSNWWRESAEQVPVSNGEERRAWPSRPGQPQHAFEPPRVVANSASERTNGGHQLCDEECGQGRALPLQSDDSGEGMGNADCFDRGTSASGRIDDAEAGSASEIVGDTEGGMSRQSSAGNWREGAGGASEGRQLGNTDCGRQSSGIDPRGGNETIGRGEGDIEQTECGQAEQSMGLPVDESSNGMGYSELSSLSNQELAEIYEWMERCDNRTDELRLLGNGVVPATATLAFRTLLAELLHTQGIL